MSVLEEFRAMEERLTARLREVEPLVTEYLELRALADRLGIDTSAHPPVPDGRKQVAGRSSSAPARRTSAARASRRDEVLAAVRERPGITVPELGRHLGVDPTSLYRVVRRLEQQGQVTKQGRNVEPV